MSFQLWHLVVLLAVLVTVVVGLVWLVGRSSAAQREGRAPSVGPGPLPPDVHPRQGGGLSPTSRRWIGAVLVAAGVAVFVAYVRLDWPSLAGVLPVALLCTGSATLGSAGRSTAGRAARRPAAPPARPPRA